MIQNIYIESSYIFLQESASRISEEMTEADVIQATLNFAIGMERLLKGVIFDINPTYVLITPEFNHSLKVLYKNKILKNGDAKSILATTPTSDVITFRNSILRSSEVSIATQKNKNRLFGLSNFRDIIVHNDLKLFDVEKAQMLLRRDYYLILLDFIGELNIRRVDFFGNNENSLLDISKNNQEDIRNILRLKLEEHLKRWEKISNDRELVRQRKTTTDELLESKSRHETTCPACNQSAVLFVEADYIVDMENAEKIIAGEFARVIHCEFCGLHINDETELDELGYGMSFHPNFDDDIPF